MPKNAYLHEQIGADAAENEHNCHEILPIVARRCRGSIEDIPPGSVARANFEDIFKSAMMGGSMLAKLATFANF